MYHAAPATFDPTIAFAIWTAAIASFYLVGMVRTGGLFGLLSAQAMLLVAPIVAARATRHGARALGLALPRARYLAAAVLIGATAWYLNWRLIELVLPRDDDAPMQTLIGRSSLGVTLLAVAVIPAVCEELVFRGVLARSLAVAWRAPVGVAVSAILFSAYHLSVVQALPTLTLGALLATLAVRADSVWPSMLAHVLNNGVAIVIARGELPNVAIWINGHPTATLAVAAIATGGGLAIALAPRAQVHA